MKMWNISCPSQLPLLHLLHRSMLLFAYIKKVIGTEEANFARTIDAGMNILSNLIDAM